MFCSNFMNEMHHVPEGLLSFPYMTYIAYVNSPCCGVKSTYISTDEALPVSHMPPYVSWWFHHSHLQKTEWFSCRMSLKMYTPHPTCQKKCSSILQRQHGKERMSSYFPSSVVSWNAMTFFTRIGHTLIARTLLWTFTSSCTWRTHFKLS